MSGKMEQLSVFDLIEPKLSVGGCGACVCKGCMRQWQGRCPYGRCFDDVRAKNMPYDKAHPGVIRKQWSEWNKPGEQEHWCRGGAFYPTTMCDNYVKYQKPVVKECLEALVTVWPDGYIDCSLVSTIGCESCMKRWEEKQLLQEG